MIFKYFSSAHIHKAKNLVYTICTYLETYGSIPVTKIKCIIAILVGEDSQSRSHLEWAQKPITYIEGIRSRSNLTGYRHSMVSF